MTKVLATNVIHAIDWYQRVVSPHKGFACAYRVAWGGHSCSGAVKSAFVDGGAIGGVRALFAQPFKCYHAAHMLAKRGASQHFGEEGPAVFCCFFPF